MGSLKRPHPCSAFRRHTHSTAFTLVVYAFLIRYSHPSELDHLVSCLSTLYELKVHRDLPRYTYLGYTLDYSHTSPSPCMTLFMPNYIPSMLSHLCPSGCGSASSPAVYTPPVSYTDLSLHLSPSSITTPSTPVGSLLFYARALDLSLLTAVCQLSSHQFTPTQHDLSSAHRLLNYASSHPNHHKTIHPPSWLSGPARTPASCPDLSRAVWLAARLGLGTPHPTFLTHPQKVTDKVGNGKTNSPLSVPPACYNPTPLISHHPLSPITPLSMPSASCQRIPVMVASVAEAEYGATFGGGQVLVELTLSLVSIFSICFVALLAPGLQFRNFVLVYLFIVLSLACMLGLAGVL
jgi:hypothetical protein